MEGLEVLSSPYAANLNYRPGEISGATLEPIEEDPSAKRQKTGWQCELCTHKPYTEKRSLVRHVQKEHTGKQVSIRCLHIRCPKTFTREDDRERHDREQHQGLKRTKPRRDVLPRLNRNSSSMRGFLQATHDTAVVTRASSTASSNAAHSHADRRSLDASPSTTSPPISVYSSSSTNLHPETTGSPSRSRSNSFRFFRSRGSSFTGSDISSGSSLRHSIANSSVTSYGSDIDQQSIVGATHETKTRLSHDEDRDTIQPVPFPLHSHEDLVKKGANSRPASCRKVRLCTICHKPFGNTINEVRSHVQDHCLSTQGQHWCDICQIGFVRKQDLDFHLTSASRGSCGFLFDHNACTGHHPPSRNQHAISDNDKARLSLSTSVWSWECHQLRDLIVLVDQVTTELEQKSESSDTWSVDGLVKSIQSLSVRNSGHDVRSTPETMQRHIRTAMLRVRRRVPIGQDASIRIKVRKKPEEEVRLGRELVAAAGEGNLLKIGELVRRGAPVNGVFEFKCRDGIVASTPLLAAICSTKVKAVDFLLKSGAAVDGSGTLDDVTGTNPLCLAAAGGSIDIVRCLLDHGANVDKQVDYHGGHAACYAARNGHTDVLSLLMDHETNIHLLAGVEEIMNEEEFRSRPLARGNILALAVYHGHLETVQMLLARVEVDDDYCDASAALAMAAYQGNLAIITLFLATHPHLCSLPSVWVADSQGHNAVVDTLVEHQRQLKPHLPMISMMGLEYAVSQCLADLASRIISPHDEPNGRCDLEMRDCRRYEYRAAYGLISRARLAVGDMREMDHAMALNAAIYYQNLEAVFTLLECGVGANAKIYPSSRRYLASNLSLAVRMGCADVVGLLLSYGAQVSKEGYLSLDLLEAALESGDVGLLQVLLDTVGTLPVREDRYSCSAFNASVQRAVQSGATELLSALIHRGLDVNQVHVEYGSFKKTVLLHLAAATVPNPGSVEMIKLLLDNGADPRARHSSRTASEIIYARCRSFNEAHAEYGRVKKVIEMLTFWERRLDIMGL